MPMLKNSATQYGTVARFLHWAVFLLFVFQYVSANIMTNLARDKTLFGLTQGHYYDWHKSIGLTVLGLAVLRWLWRKMTQLPDWAPTLSQAERVISHRNEMLLYGCMVLLPVSGYVFVMAGGFGVKLFGLHPLPNPIGKQESLAALALVTHIVLGYAAVVFIAWHVGLGLKHHLFDQDRFLNRMLPFKRQ
ncbi:MAG: cytochrome b [Candidatus Competibacteraceae bacterium]|nr:cytochrome b [Candidatus Competibacteraceae bacterium]